jgi:hypothetical protein
MTALSPVLDRARPRVDTPARTAVTLLARVEARRMVLHPAPWIGLLLSAWFVHGELDQTWSGALYYGLPASSVPLLLGVSLAAVSSFAREHVPVADEAPLSAEARAWGRLLGGLALVALVAVVVAAALVWVRVRGGLQLGDEPGRTEHAFYVWSDVLQVVLLGAFAVALGAAVVHLIRNRLAVAVGLFVFWFLVSVYWAFDGAVVRWFTPLLVQPLTIDVGRWDADPNRLPADWLLSAPTQYQDFWGRLVVSPALAGWHDLYLVGVTALLLAAAVPGRSRRWLLAGGLVVVVAAVLLQWSVTP